MLLHAACAVRARLRSICILSGLLVAAAVASCDKAPLLAPSGTVIFLNATSSSLAAHGTTEIIAVLLEQGTTTIPGGSTSTPSSGTPVHNGTLVSFTSTIGRIDPAEARTENGRVTVRFIGDGRSGAATILAYSGGARAELSLNVGAAAADRVLVTATPLSSSGGTSTVRATVQDTSGNALPGVSVQFSTTKGTLSATSAITDASGIAAVTLTTTAEATVTATAGSKSATATVSVASRSGLTLTVPSTVTAGAPAQFSVTVTAGTGVQNVVLNWGDGETNSLGAINGTQAVSHTYGRAGSYVVTATATMADGSTEPSVSTSVGVGAFSVSLSATPQTVATGGTVTFTATVAPNTVNVLRYDWNFGDGRTTSTDGPSVQHQYTAPGAKTATVTVVPVKGDARSNQVVVNVT